MTYPEDFTAEDIMEFEYEWERYCDLADPYSLASINAELQIVAETQQQKLLDLGQIWAG
jgi:hypothetical protein